MACFSSSSLLDNFLEYRTQILCRVHKGVTRRSTQGRVLCNKSSAIWHRRAIRGLIRQNTWSGHGQSTTIASEAKSLRNGHKVHRYRQNSRRVVVNFHDLTRRWSNIDQSSVRACDDSTLMGRSGALDPSNDCALAPEAIDELIEGGLGVGEQHK